MRGQEGEALLLELLPRLAAGAGAPSPLSVSGSRVETHTHTHTHARKEKTSQIGQISTHWVVFFLPNNLAASLAFLLVSEHQGCVQVRREGDEKSGEDTLGRHQARGYVHFLDLRPARRAAGFVRGRRSPVCPKVVVV